MHILRKYSALAVVLASALFVSFNNFEMRRSENGLLPFHNETEEGVRKNGFRALLEKNTELASLPYVKPETGVKTTQEEDLAELLRAQNVNPESHLRVQSLIATANAMEKDPDEGDGVKLYTVKEGDTLSSIASKNGITINTILWANTVDDQDSIKPGDEIFVLPVPGLKHIVKDGETIEHIADSYKADKDRIISFNNLPANGTVESGQEIIIPGGEKELPKKETATPLLEKRTYISSETTGGGSKVTVSKNHSMPNTFPYGYCTWYVAQKKHVPWRGNAGAWLYNARAMGYKTGKSPQSGSIVVTTDNTYYGHVALVESVSDDTITVSEMNYKRWGKVNTRVIPRNDRKIRGFIY